MSIREPELKSPVNKQTYMGEKERRDKLLEEFDDEKIKEVIRIQEKLGDSFGRKRRKV